MRKGIISILAMAISSTGALAAPETLRFEGAKGDFFVKVDYDRAPDRIPPPGARWSDFEEDSAWTDTLAGTATYHLRYTHVFYISQGGQNGVGFDRIRYDHSGSPGGSDAADASFSFLFNDGSKETVYSSLDHHYKPRTDLDPAHNPGFEIGGNVAVQTYESFLPTGEEKAVVRARMDGFDGRLGPGPFRGRDYAGSARQGR
jgi:hypothetical protein